MGNSIVRYASELKSTQFEWGSLTWYASAAIGNSTDITVGKCVIKPGKENPVHRHPNCSEVLVVLQGTVEHLCEEGRKVRLNPGDSIVLPANLPHNARNVSCEEAVLVVAFPSGNRETLGEEEE